MAVADGRRRVFCGHNFQPIAQRSNVVRIFLSSTFHDFVHERNRLFNHAFPELEQWCQERGLQFQVVDMRWGIRDNVAMDHGGPAICLREVDRCRQMSVGPNFVAFIGDRYGNRPIPATVPSSDFDSILMQVQSEDQRALFISSYRLDKNAVPPVYLLQSSVQSETSQQTVEDGLRDIFTVAAQKAAEKGAIRFAHPYSASITEQEIWNGVLLNDEPEMHCLVFVRNFQQGAKLPPKNQALIRRFADFNENGDIDPVSEKMLYDLKNYILPSKLDDSNMFRYSIPFDTKVGIDPVVASHAKYLNLINDTLLKNTKELISEGLKEVQKTAAVNDDELYGEVSSHAGFAVAKAKLYCGKRKFLTHIYRKLMDHENHQPYILYGESGVGKTATVAKLILEAHKNIVNEKSKPANIVYRFLGTTPDSSNLDRLLISLTKQICEIYETVPEKEAAVTDFTHLTDMFYRALETASVAAGRLAPLVIILDSLDQLSSNYGAHLMTWLRPTVPNNVSILLTTMPGAFDILDRLQSRFAPTTIELTESANEKASTVLMRLLKENGRTITSSQAKHVAKVFQVSQSPLLLHLTLIETRRWWSFTSSSELRLGSTVTEAIDVLFDRMENAHGRILVAHALGYLVASKNGLSAQEMEDVLSLDDEVLDDVYQYWPPPSNTEIRIPPLIWARLQEDMSDFIVLKQRDGVTVMGMYHKQFTEAVRVRYLGNETTRRHLHTTLAEYFDGVWASRSKAISLKILKSEHREFNRKVRAQPLLFAKDRYNLRKMNELPHHLIAAKNSSKLINDIFTNINWLEAKCQACGTDALIADIDEYLAEEKGDKKNASKLSSVVAIRQALRLAKPTIYFTAQKESADGSSAERTEETCLATELLGRLHNHADNSEVVSKLLSNARDWCGGGMAGRVLLVPENQCFSSPSGPLETTLAISGAQPVAAVVHSIELGVTVTIDVANTLRLWNLSTDSVVHTAKIGDSYLYKGNNSHPDAVVLSNDHKHIFSWNSNIGLLCFGVVAAAQLYIRSPEQLISHVEATDISVPPKPPTPTPKKSKSLTQQFCLPLNDRRLALASSNSQEVLIVDSLDASLQKRFRLSAPSTSLSFDGDSVILIGCEETLISVSLTDWQVSVENVAMSVISAECIYISKKRYLALMGFNDQKTTLLVRRQKKAESGGKVKTQLIPLHNTQRAQLSQMHNVCVCAGFKHDVVVLLTAGWVKKKVKQKSTICSMKVADHPSNSKSALLFVGNAETVSVYDCCGSVPIVQEISGSWGQPNLLHVGGQFIFVASTQSPFVKVWNMGRLIDKNNNHNNLNRELGKKTQSTCWLSEKRTICCHLSDSKNSMILDEAGLQSTEVDLAGNVTVVFCLVSENDLVYVTEYFSVCRLTLSDKNPSVLLKLSSPVVNFSHSKEHTAIFVLVEDGSVLRMNVNDWTSKLYPKANVAARICDVGIFDNYQLLFCEKEAVLTTFGERQDQLMTFDWPQHAVVAYSGCRNLMAVCLHRSPEADKIVEVWNLSAMKQTYSVSIKDMTSVNSMCLSVDAKYLLIGGDDRFIRVFDTQSGTVLRKNVYLYSPIQSVTAFDAGLVGALLTDRKLCRLRITFPTTTTTTTTEHRMTKANQNRSTSCTVL